MNLAELTTKAKCWLAADPDPTTRAELEALLTNDDRDALAERFGRPLGFGTAGIRGLRGAGPGRMNRLLVRLATAALGRVILDRVANAAKRGVVVGFDARHYSRIMALDACSVLAGLGIRVHFLGSVQPTPLAAFAVLETGAAGGVVLTASHNPPQYNGYKVFWDNGAQIVPPIDGEISAAIDAIDLAVPLPWLGIDAARKKHLLIDYGPELEEAYLRATRLRVRGVGPEVKIVYTPLHGVAGRLALRAFAQQGFARISVVSEQFQPNGDFPTVDYPNPEEYAPLALAVDQAQRELADLIIANDPDGDRLAVVVRSAGGYRQLTGDQIGYLLGDYLLASYGKALPEGAFVMATIVSSMLLDKIASAYGARCEQTLPGLKWVWNRALEVKEAGGTFLFGYEEAIGYTVCPTVHDKDGISAAVLFAELARACAASGRTVLDRLDDLYRRVGLSATRQISLHLPGQEGAARIRTILDRLRREPPSRLGAQRVRSVADLEARSRIEIDSGKKTPIALPAANIIQLELAEGGRVSLRPSGTEPKLKIYLEIYTPPEDGVELEAVKQLAENALDGLESAVRDLL